jgi:hypothetical protein
MKRLMLMGAAVCALAALPVLPASAMPFGSLAPAVTQTDEDAILVRHRNRGHHYGWHRSRGHHYGLSRGHHYGWSRHQYYRG